MAYEHKKNQQPTNTSSSQTRRTALKKIALGGGIAAGATALPSKWTKPIIDRVMVPAHAQTSPDEPNPVKPKLYELYMNNKMRVAGNPPYDAEIRLITAEVKGTNVKVVIWSDFIGRKEKSVNTAGTTGFTVNFKHAKKLLYTDPSQAHKELNLKQIGDCPTPLPWRVRVNNLNDATCKLGIHKYKPNPILERVTSLMQDPDIVDCGD